MTSTAAVVPPSDWNEADVTRWLSQNGFSSTSLVGVTGKVLSEFTADALKAPPYSLPADEASKLVTEIGKVVAASALNDIFDSMLDLGDTGEEETSKPDFDFLASTESDDEDDDANLILKLSKSSLTATKPATPPASSIAISLSPTPSSPGNTVGPIRAPMCTSVSTAFSSSTPALPSEEPGAAPLRAEFVRNGKLITLVEYVPGVSAPRPPKEFIYRPAHLLQMIHTMDASVWDPSTSDYWSTASPPHESWVAQPPINALQNGMPLVDMKIRQAGYSVEIDWNSVSHNYPVEPSIIVDANSDTPFYKETLSDIPHKNYVIITADCPYIISVDAPTRDNGCRKVLIRTKSGDKRILLPASDKANFLSYIAAFCLRLPPDAPFIEVKNPAIVKELIQFDARNMVTTYKFAVLYCKALQHVENDIYSNKDGSPQYQEFLRFLGNGEPITLLNWPKFRGGLDIRTNITGEKSVYTEFRGYEIMFHVATMLPFQEGDPQRIERKRHLGNDVVMIVFKEMADDMDLFNPKIIMSHFNNCFFVITPITNSIGKTTHYKMTVANKEGIPPYSPFMPDCPIFPKDNTFRDFLLLKLINAERTTVITAKEFRWRLEFARSTSLTEMCTKYSKP
ncbi:GTPaseactivating protein [Pelomyxa schiedti]|nr:GTPaseactivating protein [Pelomyxa schiedti]